MNKQHHWNPWPVSIISFFAVAIIGCGTFIVFCSRHPADLVTADYYEQELRYQGQINRMHPSGPGPQLAAVAYDAAKQRITISLPPGQLQAHVTGNIQLYRPSATDLDRMITFEPNEAGIQTIDASQLIPGLWKVRVSWAVNNQEYFVDQKLVIVSNSNG
jgi:hypothetical protein